MCYVTLIYIKVLVTEMKNIIRFKIYHVVILYSVIKVYIQDIMFVYLQFKCFTVVAIKLRTTICYKNIK